MRIITYNVNGIRAAMGKGLIDWIKESLLETGKISKEDMDLFSLVNTAEEAVQKIEEFYEKYALKPNF